LETITIALDNGESSVSVNINDTSVAAAPSYTLDLGGIASINEGSNLTVTLTTANVTDNTTVPYTISGTGITSADINGNALTGNFTVTSNTATLILPITSDATTESLETITIALDNGESSVSVNINDTSVAATQYNLVTGNLITAAQYNLLRAQLEDVLHDMYGQQSSTWQLPSTSNFVSTVSTGQTIGKAAYSSGSNTYISEIEKLYLSIARAHYHQTGVLPPNLIVPLTGYTYGADATSASFSGHIDNITKENPGKVTTLVPHGLQTGMTVNIDGVVGMTNVNNSQFTVTVVDETNFTIGVNTVNYPRHESRGTFTITNANISNSDQFGYNDYLSAINTIRTYALISQNYILPINNANNYSVTTLDTSTRTTAWGNTVDIITHEVTVTFNTAGPNRTRTSYFEAGGEIWFTAGISGGTNTADTKYASWNGLIATIGTVKFGRDVTTNGTITDTDGYNDLTATYKEIFRADASAGVYAENDYNIQAKLVDSNKIQFLIEFRDDDAGDQQDVPEGEAGPAGAAEDEDVGGTTASTVSAYVPDSSFTYNGSTITAVYFPDPTCVVDSALE
jgi:hypothetical protein